ncbi:Metalloendopeptidase-like membrane protein [Candidatus Terasakiella magnetica]|nr:Metalloendopeptidase-like membrane protein [Candidatus Terasakiella magnetica]
MLAMAASDNEAEALHALRTASRLLEGAGLDFVAVAARLSDGGPLRAAATDHLEDAIFDLRNEVRHLRTENERLRRDQPAAAANSGLAVAAQDAAQLIRLRAELDQARESLATEAARAAKAEADERSLRDDLGQAIAVAERLTHQFEQLKGRKDRLEAEVRRLSLVAGALKAELDERIADQTHPLPTPTQRPDTIIRPEPAPRRAMPVPPLPAARRGKAVPANQYALF